MRIPSFWCGPSNARYGLTRFGVAPGVGDMDSKALVWLLELGIRTPTLWRGPSDREYGLPCFCMTPQVRETDSHALAWPNRGATPKRGSPYPQLEGPRQSVGVRIPHSRGHPKAYPPLEGRDTDSHALVWPLELGIQTPTLWCGPSSWGYRLPHFGVAPQVGDTDSHALVWPLKCGIRTPTHWCGPLSWG